MLARHHPRVKPAIIGCREPVLHVTLRGTSDTQLRVVGGEGEGAGNVLTEAERGEGDYMEDVPSVAALEERLSMDDEASQGHLGTYLARLTCWAKRKVTATGVWS